MTCFKDTKLTTQFLGLVCVVVNLGGVYGIPAEDEVVPEEQPEEQLRPRGRRNM